MNRYEVAHLFIKTVEQLKAKEQECEELKETFKFVLDETIKEHRLYESKLERIIYEQL
jgi:hypothetical protein